MLHRTSFRLLLMPAAALAISILTIPAHAQPGVQSFFNTLVGEWVGTCVQSTDGKPADNKYFHAVIKQSAADTFVSQFDYYRIDEKSGMPLRIGDSLMTTKIGADGMVTNTITGKGQVMIDEHTSKPQQHNLSEALSMTGPASLKGTGKGKINVSGMPFNAGKNGKVKNDTSSWSLQNGVLKISQRLNVGFKALIFSKSFNIAADFTARRGKDVVALMMSNTSTRASR